MLRQNIQLFLIVTLFSMSAFSVTITEKEKLLEELTGHAQVKKVKPAPPSLSAQHLQAGLTAVEKNNYILALKHFNTVIAKNNFAQDVKAAYRAKGELYLKMGLTDQAQLNFKMAGGNQQITR